MASITLQRFAAIGWLITSGVACRADSPTESHDADGLDTGSVCPSCVALNGGETNDFDGDESTCSQFFTSEEVSLEAAADLGFDTSPLSSIATGQSLSSTLMWAAGPDYVPGDRYADVGVEPTGFEPNTTVAITIHPTGPVVRRFLDPQRCDASGNCRDSRGTTSSCAALGVRGEIALRADIQIETTDGAVRTSTAANIVSRYEGFATYFRVSLADVVGRLRVGTARSEAHTGYLDGAFFLATDRVRGTITPVVESVDPNMGWRYRPLTGHFPADDDCGMYERPLTPDTDEEAIASASDLYSHFREQLAESTPANIGWSFSEIGDAAETASLSVAIAPTAQIRCLSPDGMVAITTQATLTTSDGRVDWAPTLQGGLRDGVGNEPASLQLFFHTYVAATDRFWQNNIRGIALGTTSAAELILNIRQDDQQMPQWQAALSVIGVRNCTSETSCQVGQSDDCRSCSRYSSLANFATR